MIKWLFSSKTVNKTSQELVIALIPHIVRRPDYSDEELRGIAVGNATVVKLNYAPRAQADAAEPAAEDRRRRRRAAIDAAGDRPPAATPPAAPPATAPPAAPRRHAPAPPPPPPDGHRRRPRRAAGQRDGQLRAGAGGDHRWADRST